MRETLALALVALVGCSAEMPAADASLADAPVVCPRACGRFEECCVTDDGPQCVATSFNDENNCGACGHRCGAGEACGYGECYMMSDCSLAMCDADSLCCDDACVSMSGTVMPGDGGFFHCGACGHGCNPNTADRCGVFSGVTQCMCGSEPACTGAETCGSSGCR